MCISETASVKFTLFKRCLCAAGVVLLLVGNVFLGMAFAMALDAACFLKHGIRAEAIVGDAWDDNVMIRYQAGGDAYAGFLGRPIPSVRKGDPITVYYDPENPGRIRTCYSGPSKSILLTAGMALATCGSLMLIFSQAGRCPDQWLPEDWDCVWADIISIEKDQGISDGGTHPYRLICGGAWPDGTVREFCSGPIWYDPSSWLKGGAVPVYLNPEDSGDYYVDIRPVLPYDEMGRKWEDDKDGQPCPPGV